VFNKIKKKWLKSRSDKKIKKLHKAVEKLSEDIIETQAYQMNTYMAKFILPLLREYRNHIPVKHEYMTEYEFIEAIDNIIYAFEFYADDRRPLPVDHDRLKKGLKQFSRNFYYFGW